MVKTFLLLDTFGITDKFISNPIQDVNHKFDEITSTILNIFLKHL